MRALEELCCVVTVTQTPQNIPSELQNKAISCSGVFLNSQPGMVVCTGLVFSRFLHDKLAVKPNETALHSDSFRKDTHVYVDFMTPSESSDQARAEYQRHVTRQAAELVLMFNCVEFQDALSKLFKRTDSWSFYADSEDTEVSEDSKYLSWFAILKVNSLSTFNKTVQWLKSDTLKKGVSLLTCGSPFAGLCPDLFMNTVSKGIVSNLAGDGNACILTDARCLPGTEGGGVFVHKGGRFYIVGVIVSPMCWKSAEWIGLTLVCSFHSMLKHMPQAKPSQLSPRWVTDSLQAPLTVAQTTDCQIYPEVVLIDAGQVWGSGVLLNPGLVVTCRHVVNRKRFVTVKISCDIRFRSVSGKVLYSSPSSSPYDIAMVVLQEALSDFTTPQLAKTFKQGERVAVVGFGALGGTCGPSVTSGILSRVITHQSQAVMLQTTCAVQSGTSGGAVVRFSNGELLGIVSSNTRDTSAKVTYPHLNFSIPVSVLEPLLRVFAQREDAEVFEALDSAAEGVRNIWRLQGVQSKL